MNKQTIVVVIGSVVERLLRLPGSLAVFVVPPPLRL